MVTGRSRLDAVVRGAIEATRQYLLTPTSIFGGNLEEATRLFAGRPELAEVLARYHGRDALVRSHALIREAGLEAEARAAALVPLIEFEPFGDRVANSAEHNTRRILALAFAVLFREAPGELPAIVLASLPHGGGVSYVSHSDADKALLRGASEALDPAARALVAATFYL